MSKRGDLYLYCVCAVVLASTPLASKLSIVADGFDRTFAAPLRLTISILTCVVVSSVFALYKRSKGQKFRFLVKSEVPIFMVVGAISGAVFVLHYFALSRTPSAMMTFTSGLNPFFVFFLMQLSGAEEVKKTSLIGFAISFAGVFILSADGWHNREIGLLPMLALVVSSLMIAGTSILLKRAKHSSKLGAQFVTYSTSTVICWLNWAWNAGWTSLPATRPSTLAIAALLYTAIAGSFCGFLLHFAVFRRSGAITASSLALAQPPIALLLGFWFEQNAHFTGQTFAALGLVFTGVALNWVVQLCERKPKDYSLRNSREHKRHRHRDIQQHSRRQSRKQARRKRQRS